MTYWKDAGGGRRSHTDDFLGVVADVCQQSNRATVHNLCCLRRLCRVQGSTQQFYFVQSFRVLSTASLHHQKFKHY